MTWTRRLCGLAALAVVAAAGAGCETQPRRTGTLPGGAGGPAAGARPAGVRPNIPTKDLEARDLDVKWTYYLAENVLQVHLVEDLLFLFTDKKNLWAVEVDSGFVTWMYHIGEDLSYPPAMYSYKRDGIPRTDELFLIAKDTLHVVDPAPKRGFLLWKKRLPFAAASAPAASISHVYIGSWDHRVYAIDKASQAIDWSYRTQAPVVAPVEPAEKTVEAVFAGSEDGRIYAFSPVREDLKWAVETDAGIVSRPLFFKNFLYVGSKDMSVYCIATINGSLDWEFPTGAPVTQTPVAYTGDTVYVMSDDNFLYSVNRQPTDPKKKYEVRWQYPRGRKVLAKGRETIYVLAGDDPATRDIDEERSLVAIEEKTGKVLWRHPFSKDVDFFVTNPFSPTSLVEKDKRLASTIILTYRDGWMIALKEKAPF